MENIEETIATIKETLIYLVEQEKVRAEEIQALNEKIEAVNETMVNQVINPMLELHKEEEFEDFNSKYGERLGKYDGLVGSAINAPDYNATKEAFNEWDALSAEDKEKHDLDKYVDDVEAKLDAYVSDIKAKLGIPADAPTEIKDDGNGNQEVSADMDGDGKLEEVTETTEEVKEAETPEEEVGSSEEEDSDTLEVDPELEKELSAYAEK